jgi:hypothetical protein
MLRWLLAVAAAVSVAAQPRVDAVVNGASFETGISRGSLVSIAVGAIASLPAIGPRPVPHKVTTCPGRAGRRPYR